MNKRLLTTITIATYATAAFLGGYLIMDTGLFGEQRAQQEAALNSGATAQKPGIQTDRVGDIVPLGSSEVVSPLLVPGDNVVRYYEQRTGRVLEIGLTNFREKILSDTPLPDFISAVWSPTGTESIGIFANGDTNEFRHYDFTTKTATVLPAGTRTVAFSPTGSQMVSLRDGDTENEIILSQPDGTFPRPILKTRLEQAELLWPEDQRLSIVTQRGTLSDVFTLTKDGKLQKLLFDQNAFDGVWSPDGTHLLYSAHDESGKVVLSIMDAATSEATTIPLAISASQCAWGIGNTFLVCAGPDETKGSLTDATSLYSIDLDGTKKLLATSSLPGRLHIERVLLPTLQHTAVILNGIDHKLYRVSLPVLP